jgi:hypothetical protein
MGIAFHAGLQGAGRAVDQEEIAVQLGVGDKLISLG